MNLGLEKLKGLFTALITPFKENFELDEEGLRLLIHRQIAQKTQGLVILGSTGESPTLSSEEQKRIICIAVEEASNKVPIFIGTGANCTKTTIEKTKKAKELGADGALIVTPYYNKPSQEGIFKHFEAVAKAVDFPIIVYNISSRTGVNIETQTMTRLASIKQIIAVKESSGNINQAADVIFHTQKIRPDFAVLAGDDALTVPMMSLGASGIISVVSNLVSMQMRALVDAASANDFFSAQKWHHSLLPLFHGAFIESNPSPIKMAMNYCGLPAGPCRPPLDVLLPHNEQNIKKLIEEMKLSCEQKDFVIKC